MRFDTGSSRDAVLAIHTVVRVNGNGDSPTCPASNTTTGVSSPAAAASSVTTVMASTTSKIGQTRSPHGDCVRDRQNAERTAPASLSSAVRQFGSPLVLPGDGWSPTKADCTVKADEVGEVT